MNRNPATLWKYLAVAGTGTAPTLQPLTFNSFNQISNPTTFTYDNDGDQTADATSSYKWYASGELEQAFAVTYSYDGDGNRVMKSNGKIYWRDPNGRVLDESDLSGNFTDEYVYFGNQRIAHRAVSTNVIYYYAADGIGSSRSLASTATTPCFDADYYPFGGEHDYVNTCTTTYKFTSQERDAESASANDYFGARYDSNLLGRFISPDAFFHDSHVGEPQSWNKYAYARNNPLRYNDPSGNTATVTTSCTADLSSHTTCQVTISATIAIYAVPGSGITQDQLDSAASSIQSQIQGDWSGSFSQDGVDYNVSTQVNVSIVGSQDAGIDSGAQNVIGLQHGQVDSEHDSLVNVKGGMPGAGLAGVDTGVWNIDTIGDNVPGHEFGHLLGIGDRSSGQLLMHNNQLNDKSLPVHATATDLALGVKEATDSVGLTREIVRMYNGGAGALPTPFPFSATDTVGAPWLTPWWK